MTICCFVIKPSLFLLNSIPSQFIHLDLHHFESRLLFLFSFWLLSVLLLAFANVFLLCLLFGHAHSTLYLPQYTKFFLKWCAFLHIGPCPWILCLNIMYLNVTKNFLVCLIFPCFYIIQYVSNEFILQNFKE